MPDPSGEDRSGATSLDTALLDARAELAVLTAAGAGIPDDGIERVLASADLALTLVNIRVAEASPRPVMKARFELTHQRTGEGRIVEVFVPAPSGQPQPAEVEVAKAGARHHALQQLIGSAAVDEGRRARQPTIELPEIND